MAGDSALLRCYGTYQALQPECRPGGDFYANCDISLQTYPRPAGYRSSAADLWCLQRNAHGPSCCAARFVAARRPGRTGEYKRRSSPVRRPPAMALHRYRLRAAPSSPPRRPRHACLGRWGRSGGRGSAALGRESAHALEPAACGPPGDPDAPLASSPPWRVPRQGSHHLTQPAPRGRAARGRKGALRRAGRCRTPIRGRPPEGRRLRSRPHDPRGAAARTAARKGGAQTCRRSADV